MRFRKKVVVVEAEAVDVIQWLGDTKNWGAVWDFMNAAGTDMKRYGRRGGPLSEKIEIATTTSTMLLCKGDWLIKSIAGELSVCKPEIFAATYEAVEGWDGMAPGFVNRRAEGVVSDDLEETPEERAITDMVLGIGSGNPYGRVASLDELGGLHCALDSEMRRWLAALVKLLPLSEKPDIVVCCPNDKPLADDALNHIEISVHNRINLNGALVRIVKLLAGDLDD